MSPECNLGNIRTVTFGIGRDDVSNQPFTLVPVDGEVQDVLTEMLQATWGALHRQGDPHRYEPSEKHARIEFLYLPTDDPLAQPLYDLHHAVNLSVDGEALELPDNIFAYFAQFIDATGKRLTALRRASQFKGILKCRHRLMRQFDDTLMIVPDNIFKLDADFDLLIDDTNVLILRPSGFEFAGKLQQAILDAVPSNVEALKTEITFVNFEQIESYASTRSRAARYIASIRSQPNNEAITIDRLCQLCNRTGVEVMVEGGRVTVAEKHELAFLELLDRRRYEVDLTESDPELYRAGSRSRISGQ